MVKGDIIRSHMFNGGSYSVTLVDNGSDITVYIPYRLAPALKSIISLENVTVKGTVEHYNGALEIVADSLEYRP